MSVAKHVYPFPILFVAEIGPDDDALVRHATLWVAMVSYLTDGDHSIARREVRNMVDLSMNSLQAGKEPFPSLADLVTAPMKFAVRRDEEDVGAARKQAHYFVGVEQSMPFEQLSVQFLVCGKNVRRQSVRLRVCGYGYDA